MILIPKSLMLSPETAFMDLEIGKILNDHKNFLEGINTKMFNTS